MSTITVTGLSISNYQRPGSTAYLRLYSLGLWVDSLGNEHPQDAVGGNNFYLEIPLSVSGSVATAASFTLTSTDDAQINSGVKLAAALFDSTRSLVSILHPGLVVNSSFAPTTTWASILLANASTTSPPLPTYPTTDTVNNLIHANQFPHASETVEGGTKLSVAPASLPVAVGDNDPRMTAVSNATDQNTASTIVKRDSNKHFEISSLGVRGGQIDVGASLITFGDSITKGDFFGITGYAAQVATAKGWTGGQFQNSAVNGSMAPDTWGQVYPITVSSSSDQAFIYSDGFNDAHVYGPDLQYQDYFRNAHLAALLWLSIPDAQKIRATDSSITYAGAWTTQTNPLYGLGSAYPQKFSNTNASTVTKTFTGGRTIFVGITRQTTVTGTFTVTIDGVVKGSYSAQAPTGGSSGTGSAQTANGLNYGPQVLCFTGLEDKAHTVILTVTSGTGGANFVYFDWIAATNGIQSVGGPRLYVGGITKPQSALFSSGGVVSPSASETVDSIYDAIIRTNAELMRAWGFSTTFVDVRPGFIPATMVQGDGIHPNQTGYDYMTGVYLYAMNGLPYSLPSVSTSRPYKIYRAVLSQSGVNAPTATVLENTLGGTPTLPRNGVGDYSIALTGAFPSGDLTSVMMAPPFPSTGAARFAIGRASGDSVEILTWNAAGAAADGQLSGVTVEIRTYL
jgi:hypothetical protein